MSLRMTPSSLDIKTLLLLLLSPSKQLSPVMVHPKQLHLKVSMSGVTNMGEVLAEARQVLAEHHYELHLLLLHQSPELLAGLARLGLEGNILR